MENKFHIEKNTVQETLMIPLYGRKACGDLYPALFRDDEAERLISMLDYDFSELSRKMGARAGQYGALEAAQRYYDLTWEVEDYLKSHPRAAVVNMGCGLDTTFTRVDNGSCRGYNLDMTDVIEVRERLLPSTERETNIACDLNDTVWFERIAAAEGAVFFAAGVFYYFTTEQVRALLSSIAQAFPGCVIVFDACNKRGLRMMLKTWVKDAGITDIGAYFAVKDAEAEISPWSKRFSSVTSRSYMNGYRKLNKEIPALFRLLNRLSDSLVNMQIVKICAAAQ